MNSALCVEYPPDLIAAAALHYAVEVTGLASRPEYHSGWEQEVGLTEPYIEVRLRICDKEQRFSHVERRFQSVYDVMRRRGEVWLRQVRH